MRQTSWLVIAAASLGLAAASACNQGGGQAAGPTYPMYSSPQMPAAQGSITAANDGNGNTELTIHVRNLAHPSRIVPNTTTYVVWIVPLQGQQQQMQPGAQQMQNQGAYGSMSPGQQGFVTSQPYPNEQQQPMEQQPPMEGQQPQGQQPMQGQQPQGQQPMQGQQMQGQQGDLYSQGLPPNAGQPMNVGVIKLGSHMDGMLKIRTPFSQFEVLITPEADASLQQPTNAPVLIARVIRG
jgi:hypothetical protein